MVLKPIPADSVLEPQGVFWRILEWMNILLYCAIIFEMIRLWTSPTPEDFPRIVTIGLVMGFEFILVHSAVFIAVMPRKTSIFFLLPIYGLVALTLNTGVDNNVILFLYLGLLFTRLRYLFSRTSAQQKARSLKISIMAAFIYLGAIAVIAIGETSLPPKGLTPEFLQSHQYFEDLSIGGVFIENPHLPLIMGIIYFSLLIVLEIFAHGLLKRRGQKTG